MKKQVIKISTILRMYLKQKVFVSLLILSSLFLSSTAYPTENKNRLTAEIDRILSHSCTKRIQTGIKIVNITTGKVLYQLNSDSLMKPASNIKLITSAAALKTLHPDYRFKTIVSTDGEITDGVLQGNIYIKGFGDPKLVSEELWILVKELVNLDIHEITGNIVGDNTFFDKEETGNGWGKKLSFYAYHAKIAPLSLNFNSIALQVRPAMTINSPPLVVPDPDTQYIEIQNSAKTTAKAKKNALIVDRVALKKKDRIIVKGKIAKNRKKKTYYRNISYPQRYILTVLKEFMEKEGVRIKGSLEFGKQPEEVKTLVTHKSRPLSYIVRDLNKMSNNFIAEQIIKTMGAEFNGEPGTTEKGLEVVKTFLQSLGIPEGSYTIADGSGLSRLNRVSPDQIIKVLEHMYTDFSTGAEYVSSLGIVGVDGSVEDRLKKSAAQRKIRAKTGTLNGVICLSGYAENSSGEILAFSLLMNNISCNPNRIMRLQDKIILSIIK